jgi:hypothetical protein
MTTTSSRRLSRPATAIVIAAAAVTAPLTHLQAQQPAAVADGPAGYDIACSIQAASGLQDCGAPSQGHTCDVESNYASQPSRESTGITFVNRSDKPVKIYWLNFRGDRILYKSLPAGGQLAQQTFVGHNWLVTTSTEQCIGIFETVPRSIADDDSVAVAPPELDLRATLTARRGPRMDPGVLGLESGRPRLLLGARHLVSRADRGIPVDAGILGGAAWMVRLAGGILGSARRLLWRRQLWPWLFRPRICGRLMARRPNDVQQRGNQSGQFPLQPHLQRGGGQQRVAREL